MRIPFGTWSLKADVDTLAGVIRPNLARPSFRWWRTKEFVGFYHSNKREFVLCSRTYLDPLPWIHGTVVDHGSSTTVTLSLVPGIRYSLALAMLGAFWFWAPTEQGHSLAVPVLLILLYGLWSVFECRSRLRSLLSPFIGATEGSGEA